MKFEDRSTAPVILLAEDGDRMRTLPRYHLERQGFCVLEAAHGLEALYLARRNGRKVDIAIAELDLRFMDGLELVSHLEHLNPNLKTVFLMENDQAPLLRPRTLSLKKPVPSAVLLRAIYGLLGANDTVRKPGGFWWMDPARRLQTPERITRTQMMRRAAFLQ